MTLKDYQIALAEFKNKKYPTSEDYNPSHHERMALHHERRAAHLSEQERNYFNRGDHGKAQKYADEKALHEQARIAHHNLHVAYKSLKK